MARQSLAGKTALVTGGARRIGRAITRALAAQGCHVVIHYRESAPDAEALAAEIRAQGVGSWTLAADLAKPAQCETLIDRALTAAGRLDFLVNNASIFPPSTLETVTFDDVLQSTQVNAWAPLALSRAFARVVDGGGIVNLLDTRVEGFDQEHVAYILSKHLLARITRMTALAFAPRIAVNAVAPGLILPPPGRDESYLDALISSVPMQRHGDATDIADAVVFLLGSTFITGQTIFVDGGRHLKEETHGSHSD